MKSSILFATMALASLVCIWSQETPAPETAEEPAPVLTIEDRLGALERRIAELEGGPSSSTSEAAESEIEKSEEGEQLMLPRDLRASLVAHARAGLPGFLEAFAAAPEVDKWSFAVAVAGNGDSIWMSLETIAPDGLLHGRRRDNFLGAESAEEALATMTDPMTATADEVIDWSYISNGKKAGDFESFAKLQYLMLNLNMRKIMQERYPDSVSIVQSVDLTTEESLLTSALDDYNGL